MASSESDAILVRDERMRFLTRKRLFLIVSVCIVLAMVWRGDYLLGGNAGIFYGLLSVACLYLVGRACFAGDAANRLQQVFAVFVALVVIILLNVPERLSWQFEVLVKEQQRERETEAQLVDMLSTNPRFSNLAFRWLSGKVGRTPSLQGNVDTESDFLALRKAIAKDCPSVSMGAISWKVIIDQSGKKYDNTSRYSLPE